MRPGHRERAAQKKDMEKVKAQRRQKGLHPIQIVLVNQRCPQGDGHKHEPRQCRRRGTAQREKIPPWIRRHAALPLLVRRMLDSEVVAVGMGYTDAIPCPTPYQESNRASR